LFLRIGLIGPIRPILEGLEKRLKRELILRNALVLGQACAVAWHKLGVSSGFVALFRGLKGRYIQLLPGILGMSAIGRPGTIAAWMDNRI
jgi:hypothetical protein